MKRLASHESLAHLGHLKNVLEQSGIRCLIKNEQLSGALGEIPFLECLPELWVVRDEDADRAEALLDSLAQTPQAASWRCTACGEPNEGQFAICWNCGAPDEHDDH